MNMYDKVQWVQKTLTSIVEQRHIDNRPRNYLHDSELEQAELFLAEIKKYIEKMIEPSNLFFELDK